MCWPGKRHKQITPAVQNYSGWYQAAHRQKAVPRSQKMTGKSIERQEKRIGLANPCFFQGFENNSAATMFKPNSTVTINLGTSHIATAGHERIESESAIFDSDAIGENVQPTKRRDWDCGVLDLSWRGVHSTCPDLLLLHGGLNSRTTQDFCSASPLMKDDHSRHTLCSSVCQMKVFHSFHDIFSFICQLIKVWPLNFCLIWLLKELKTLGIFL